ncbi:MAG: protein translocase subunit SecD [Bacillota bacterium]|nr:protein translocase subunit SecD [Bacillota bacterium]HHT90187.1 protein translocase subunit SecD [Bacillota bacterium]
MRHRSGWRIALILAIVLVSGIFLYRTPFNLGLDLKGGVHVVLEADSSAGEVTSENMSGVVSIIERRINALGVSEPLIQRQGSSRIIVELPGIHDQQQAIDTVGRTALLEFKDPSGQTVLDGSYLKQVQLGTDRYGQPAIDLEFDREGVQLFALLTTRHQGQATTIVLDGEVLQTVMIREPILEGRAQITGGMTVEEARHMVVLLQEGSLPVPMQIMEIRNVGPTLGQDSIDRSFRAGIVGVVLILLFMGLYYKLPGVVADLALLVYIVILLGVLSAIDAVLTLPGIAGIVLSVGMAVDANVLIFERIKEEIADGKRLRSAVEAGFSRAFATILDSNITTLITALVLFYVGTGGVRGFAVTLGVGILVSMFAAIVVTRVILDIIAANYPDTMARHFRMGGFKRS